MTDPAGDRGTGELDLEWPVTATPATGGFFQRPEPLPEGRALSVRGNPSCSTLAIE